MYLYCCWAGFSRFFSLWFKTTVLQTHSLSVGGLARRALNDHQLVAGGRLVLSTPVEYPPVIGLVVYVGGYSSCLPCRRKFVCG